MEWMIYGANGYTGELIAREAKRQGKIPILAGRCAAKIIALATQLTLPSTCIFNVGANVNFPILDTTERVFRKVWELACYGGFLTGREAARAMLPRGAGSIFFTGATASLARRRRLRGLRQRQVRACAPSPSRWPASWGRRASTSPT